MHVMGMWSQPQKVCEKNPKIVILFFPFEVKVRVDGYFPFAFPSYINLEIFI